MKPSLYLSQSYQDSWSDYQRSIKSPSFPVWDHIILTASNDHQAESFRPLGKLFSPGPHQLPDGSAITLDRPCPIVAGTHKAAEELKNILLFEGFTKEKGI